MVDYAAHARAAAINRAKPGALGVVHLVWAPLGVEPLRSFLRSYHAHSAGIAHELIVVLNGAQGEAGGETGGGRGDQGEATGAPEAGGEATGGRGEQGEANGAPEDESEAGARAMRPRGAARALTREALAAELAETEHRLVTLERPVPDLAAYGQAARMLTHARLCFLNSYSTILADDWLLMLARAHEDPNTGLAGATASWESQARWVRGRARYWPYQLARARETRRYYPHFPNPHVRTTAFLLARTLALGLKLEEAADKHDAYLLESGRRSITRQVLERALRAVVVGRDGRVYGIKDWAKSRTYRSGGQTNLLVADRRTRDWQEASPRLRRRLSRDAWGEHYVAD